MRFRIIIFLITMSPAVLVQLPALEKGEKRKEAVKLERIIVYYCHALFTHLAITAVFCYHHLFF